MDKVLSELEVIKEASRCLNCKIAKCQEFCPIHNEIPLINKLVKENKFADAFETITINSVLPDICSKICPHEKQCEGHCVKKFNGQGIKFSLIENYLANNYKEEYKITKNNHKVCAIGSGPASISFALYLARKGYQVDIYEKENDIGGVLYWGIPNYRLDKSILAKYKKELIDLGVNIFLNKEIKSINDLIGKYEAIFIGIGTTIPNKMNIPGEELKGVYNSYDFLRDTNLNKNHKDYGKNIIVVGGGNVAIDAARNAKRLGANVTIVYRRSEVEMPAGKEEVNIAKKEGIKFMCLRTPTIIHGDNKVNKVELAIMKLGEKDSSNRARPIMSDEPHVFLDADSIIMAIGFSANNTFTNESYIKVNDNGKTSIDKVYAGGDVVTGSKTAVLAMKGGLDAARDIEHKLSI